MTVLRYRPLFEVISTDEGFAALEPEWDGLLATTEAPTVFSAWAWVSAWRATLGRDVELRVVTARRPDDGSLAAVAPFCVARRRTRRLPAHKALQFIGSGPAAPDHLDLMVQMGHEHVARPLWEAAVAEPAWDIVDLDGLRAGSTLASVVLRRAEDRSGHLEITDCPVLALPDRWEEYEASLGRNLRQNLGRYGRKLDREAGGRVVERIVVEPEEVAATITVLARLHQEVKTANGLRGVFADPQMVAFHQLVARRLLHAGRLRLYRLDVGDEAIAVIYCFRYGDVVSFYQTGYDRSWAGYGPGRRIMAHAIRASIEEGAAEFDFLRGDEPYKRAWGTESRFDERIVMPRTGRGRLIVAARSAAKRARAVLTRRR